MEDTPHFKLGECDRCPHLNQRGLCNIILNVGEDYLCDICREHPRFYNFTSVAEVGIGMSCPEAARMILSSSEYATIEKIGIFDTNEEIVDFDGRIPRGAIYDILQNKQLNYQLKIDKICQKHSICIADDSLWLNKLDSLEYLDIAHKKLFMNYSSSFRPKNMDEYLERFLAYFIYRHCTEATDSDDFCDRLSFCLFCERLFASLIYSENAKTLQDISALASAISEEIEYSDDNTFALMHG